MLNASKRYTIITGFTNCSYLPYLPKLWTLLVALLFQLIFEVLNRFGWRTSFFKYSLWQVLRVMEIPGLMLVLWVQLLTSCESLESTKSSILLTYMKTNTISYCWQVLLSSLNWLTCLVIFENYQHFHKVVFVFEEHQDLLYPRSSCQPSKWCYSIVVSWDYWLVHMSRGLWRASRLELPSKIMPVVKIFSSSRN